MRYSDALGGCLHTIPKDTPTNKLYYKYYIKIARRHQGRKFILFIQKRVESITGAQIKNGAFLMLRFYLFGGYAIARVRVQVRPVLEGLR